MATESGIKTPIAEDLARFDKKRQGEKLSNDDDRMSKTDAEPKIARMKDGTTHLAYKPERAVDLDTGVIVAAPIHADKSDTATLDETLKTARDNLSAGGLTPTREDPCEIIADKGYHSRSFLKDLDGREWKSRISGRAARDGLSLGGRRGGPGGGLRQSWAAEIGCRARGHAQARLERFLV